MATKFKTMFGRIDKVEVDKETLLSVFIKGRRNAKRSDWQNFFDTYEEAKAFLIQEADQAIEKAKRSLEYAENEKEELLTKLK